MRRDIRRWLVAAVAAALVLGFGPGTGPATAQETDERDRAQERQERVERERGERFRERVRDHRLRALSTMPMMLGSGGGWLGVRIAEVDGDAVERLGLPAERGARVAGVMEEGPAAEAGLREDDVIVGWNDRRVESAAQLSRLVRETPAGRTVRLGVVRDGEERAVEVALGQPRARRAAAVFSPRHRLTPEHRAQMERRMEEARERMRDAEGRAERVRVMHLRGGRLGVGLQSLTEQLGDYFGLEGRPGALVTSVREGSPAERAGLRAGDVLLSIEGDEVSGPMDAFRALRGREAGPVELRVLRDGQERAVTVELEEAERSELGGFEIPGFALPALEFPGFELPGFAFPGFELPGFELPGLDFEWNGLEIESFEIPSVEIPSIDLPEIRVPPVDVPPLEAPAVREVRV